MSLHAGQVKKVIARTNNYSKSDSGKGSVSQIFHIGLRDWSLITGRRGLQNGRGGHVKFYPYEKGGGKSFSHSEGGAQKVLG